MIHLQSGSFDPLVDGPPDVPAILQAEPDKQGTAYVLIQFRGPVEQAWPEELQALGAELLDYVPDYAYVVRLPVDRLPAVTTLPQVRWVGPWQPAYRLAPELLASAAPATTATEGEESEPIDVSLATYPGVNVERLLADIAALGIEPGLPGVGEWGATLRLRATSDQITDLAQLQEVRWIEPFVPRQLANDRVQNNWLLQTAPVWNTLGLYGQGQVVGVADSGLDTGNASTVHLDVRGRIAQAFALGRPGNWSDPNGHGTHVIGSLLGNGLRSGSNPDTHQYASSAAGSAPEARLVLQSVLDANGGLDGLPLDLRNLFQPAYDAGARIHSNSWGAPVDGRYDVDSLNVDRFLWDHKDMTILFAAGNEGVDADRNGVVDPDSLYSPATAKNAIAVGASEGQRSSSVTWSAYGFTAAPLNSDLVSDNHWGMAGFSSRGPTDDSRIKPDLVAPGTNILSLRSSLAGGSGDYTLLSGTSMSTPLTAGMAALVRQWYQQSRGIANPSGALVKATLLNGAMRIDPGQYGAGSCLLYTSPSPRDRQKSRMPSSA
jgi:subtilisin family serine protease